MLQKLKIEEQTTNEKIPPGIIIGADGTALKSKKELRLERKKRKLLALSAVMMLNEEEGVRKQNKEAQLFERCKNLEQLVKPDSQKVTEAATEERLRNILVNQTNFDIVEKKNLVDSIENGPNEPKRRKAEEVSNNPTTLLFQSEDSLNSTSKPHNSEDEYRVLKAYVNQKKNMRYSPRIVLKPVGQDALLDRPVDGDRIPLLLDDIQALLMHALLRTDSPSTPRWASIQKSTKLTHTLVLIVEGFSCEDYVCLQEHMPACSKSDGIFGPENLFQVVCPMTNLIDEIACVPLSDTHKDILVAEYGSLEAAMQICKDQMLIRRSIFRNIPPSSEHNDYTCLDLPPGDKFPRTLLLLSPIQMINEGYPVPLTGTLQHRYKNYVTTSDFYLPVNPHSKMFGVDCEMCGVAGNKSALTRVSIVNEAGETIYDELVKPRQPIVDYRFKYSGITKAMLANVEKRLEDVQMDIRKLLPRDAILVGQSLNCDLDALQMMHPYVIDSSIVFNLTGNANHKAKLRLLTKQFLKKDIQSGNDGHNPIEDCSASLDLVKLKLSESIYYGDQWLQDRSKYHRFINAGGNAGIASREPEKTYNDGGVENQHHQITSTLFAHAKKRNKRSTIVTNNAEELSNFRAYFGETILQKGEEISPNNSHEFLSISQESLAEETIRKAAANSLMYDFNLVYVKLPPNENHMGDHLKVTQAQQIDKWIMQLHNSLSLNALFVTILVGKQEVTEKSNRLAVAMVQTKK